MLAKLLKAKGENNIIENNKNIIFEESNLPIRLIKIIIRKLNIIKLYM